MSGRIVMAADATKFWQPIPAAVGLQIRFPVQKPSTQLALQPKTAYSQPANRFLDDVVNLKTEVGDVWAMLIQNYGLFWRRENVFWGRQGVMGHLQGHPASSAFVVVDFRDQQGVYCLYDDNFRIVYIGQAGANDKNRLFDRLKQHRADSLADRWTRFSWFGIRWVTRANVLAAEAQGTHTTAGDVLNHIEAILISAAEPPHNRQAGRFGTEVHQYLQWRDADQLGPTSDDMIRELWRAQTHA